MSQNEFNSRKKLFQAQGAGTLSPIFYDALHALEVILSVHANGVKGRLRHEDINAVLQEAQLLQALAPFEIRFRQQTESIERRFAVCVEAEMFHAANLRGLVAIKG